MRRITKACREIDETNRRMLSAWEAVNALACRGEAAEAAIGIRKPKSTGWKPDFSTSVRQAAGLFEGKEA